MKGCKQITAMAPTGAVVIYNGIALEIRSDRTSTEHWTIHERTIVQRDNVGAILGIVPNTWALTMVLNDAA